MSDDVAILVVEDEALILLDVADQLQSAGYKVYEAANADIAIQMLSTHADICLIFTDIDMPGSMDGLKLAAAVRNRWPPVKIIVTSGARSILASDMPEGSMFFPKPYDHVAVLASMQELLR